MLWHELATKDGCTIAEAQARYTMREFIEWAAFDRIKGIRVDRETMDVLFANLCAWVIATHTKKGSNKKIGDFMVWKPRKEQRKPRGKTPIDHAKMQAWANAFIAQQTAMGNVKRA